MRYLLSFLTFGVALVLAWRVDSAVVGTDRITTEAAFTNAIKNSPVGSTLVASPRRWHFLSTDLSWLTNSLTYDFSGSTVVWGSSSDGSAKPIFHDIRQATTNYVMGGDHILSNSFSVFSFLTNVNSKVIFTPRRVYRPATSSGVPLFRHDSGVLIADIAEEVHNVGYNVYWHSGAFAGGKLYFRCPRALSANVMIDLSPANPFGEGDGYIEINTAEVDLSSGTPGISFLNLAEHIYYKGQTVLLKDRSLNLGGSAGRAIFDVARVKVDAATLAGVPIIITATAPGSVLIQDCAINVLSGIEAISLAEGLTLRNCAIYTTNAPVFVLPFDTAVTVEGFLKLNPGIAIDAENTVAVNGGGQVLVVKTNTYAGTNVVININGHEQQVVLATNAMLLILTNSTVLESGKKVSVTLYNNKSTNMNVAYTAAGFRPMGQVHNTVTNGRSLRLEITYIGTNNHVVAFQQQN